MANLSPHFTLREFTRSATAERMRIDNSLPVNLIPIAKFTMHKMELVREILGNNPVIITPGYRCKQLN